MKNNVAFTLISIAVLSFELLVQIPVQLLLELELNFGVDKGLVWTAATSLQPKNRYSTS